MREADDGLKLMEEKKEAEGYMPIKPVSVPVDST